MNKRTLALCFGLCLISHLYRINQACNANKPNVVFLMADDHQAMAMGCMGNAEIETPNLDELAARGILFERCYATSPLCMASRATVMSGMYEYKTGCNFLTGDLSSEVWKNQSYPVLLKQAGYRTAFAGKWGFSISDPESAGKSVYDASRDFDHWGALQGGQGYYATGKNPNMVNYAKRYPHVTRALGAFGRDFIKESAGLDQPFCLSLSFKAPHKPHNEIDPQDQKHYASVTFAKPPGFDQEGLSLLPVQAKTGRQFVQRSEWDKEHYQDHLKAYYQLISGVDSAVGMVVDALKERGVANNTVIIYTADNGYFCGAHGLQGKVLPYEHASRIPLIIFDPRTSNGSRGVTTKAIIGNIDFAPTMLDLAGVPIPAQMDGKSLVPIVRNPNRRVRSELGIVQNWDWANRDLPKALSVVSEDWKYILWCYADEATPVAEELFDLSGDPSELNNVAANPEKRETLETMRNNYDAFHKHWVNNCVNVPSYQRFEQIFDRKIPWQEKNFRTFNPQFRASQQQRLEEIYEDLTGAKYPKRQR
ncbi:Choline-sulfatase [Planctomycetes bacterium CA13]|uniref:Choline-sulfatase n=1 Tax=Novipirellula herctigrandis TaxID=2527986 RepID=A0A5C5Z158_9BACT|nr:Choline-sulfatase [Planctomycetes bacterium CA13]